MCSLMTGMVAVKLLVSLADAGRVLRYLVGGVAPATTLTASADDEAPMLDAVVFITRERSVKILDVTSEAEAAVVFRTRHILDEEVVSLAEEAVVVIHFVPLRSVREVVTSCALVGGA